MDQTLFSTVRRVPLLSIALLALLLSGTSCRQAICADAPDTCLELDVTAEDGLAPSGPIEVVLLDRACNMLGRYRQPASAPSTLPGLIEVRLNTEGHAPIRREAVARVVLLAWPDAGLPWSGAIGAETGARLSAQLRQPITAMSRSPYIVNEPSIMNVKELVAATNKAAQYYFFLDEQGLKGAPIKDRKLDPPTDITMNPPLSSDLSLLTAIMINSDVRISVNEKNDFKPSLSLRTSLLDTYLKSTCSSNPNPHEISANTSSSWAIVMNHSADGSKVSLLQMDATRKPLRIGVSSSRTCSGPFTAPEEVGSPIESSESKLFALYPKAGPTQLAAFVVDGKLRIFKFPNGQLTDLLEYSLPLLTEKSSLRSLVFSDINRDGRPEIIVGTHNGELLSFAEQNGVWSPSDPLPQPTNLVNDSRIDISHIRLGDFNGDTLVDVALGGADETRLYFGDGRGGFVKGSSIQVKVKAMDAADLTADLNETDAGNVCADELVVSDGSSIFLYSMEP